MILTRAQALTVKNAAKTLGVDLPTQFASDVDAASALAENAANIGDSSAALNAAVLDALAAGRDYHTDPDVTRLFLDSVLVRQNNIGEAARTRAENDIAATLAEHADTILAGWADALAPHAQALAVAATELPTHDLGDTQKIIESGKTAMRHWSAAQEAVKCWRVAVDGFVALATTARVGATKHSPLVITGAGFHALAPVETTARSTGVNVDAWLLACHGVPLHLATLGQYMERTAAYEQQRQAAAASVVEQREHDRKAALR